MATSLISVIIPIKCDGSADIALTSLRQINYPLDLIETFVVEGIQPSRQRNEAIKLARGEIIFFFDDDSIVDKELFNKTIDCYRNNKEIAAIGAVRCKKYNHFLKARKNRFLKDNGLVFIT